MGHRSDIDRGTYALVLFLSREKKMHIGALGTFTFPCGYYVYIGSALNGLSTRIARHRAHTKKMFWHVDYLLEYAQLVDVWTHAGAERLECVWARAALAQPWASVIAPRFGASDCDCATHLVYFAERPDRFLDGA